MAAARAPRRLRGGAYPGSPATCPAVAAGPATVEGETMSNQPGSSTAAEPDAAHGRTGRGDRAGRRGRQGGRQGTRTAAGRSRPGRLVLALLALGWLAAMLWSTRAAIHSAAAGVTAITLSAFALPGVISAALVAGAAVALAVSDLLARRSATVPPLRFLGGDRRRPAGRAGHRAGDQPDVRRQRDHQHHRRHHRGGGHHRRRDGRRA